MYDEILDNSIDNWTEKITDDFLTYRIDGDFNCELPPPWKVFNNVIRKLDSVTLRNNFITGMEKVNYYVHLDYANELNNPFHKFITENPEYPINDSDFYKLKFLIGYYDAYFSFQKHYFTDEKEPINILAEKLYSYNTYTYERTTKASIDSAALYLSGLCDHVNNLLDSVGVFLKNNKVSIPNLNSRNTILLNFAIYFSVAHYYSDAIKFILGELEKLNSKAVLKDRNMFNAFINSLDLKKYFLIKKEKSDSINKYISKESPESNFYNNLASGVYDYKIIKELAFIVTRPLATNKYSDKTFIASDYYDDYYKKCYSGFYNFCLEKEENFLNSLYIDSEFDSLQLSAFNLKKVILETSENFVHLIYKLSMGYLDSQNSSDALFWVSNTAELCITLGEGFSIKRTETYASLTMKSIIHNNAWLGLKMVMFSVLESLILNFSVAGHSLQDVYQAIYILTDVLKQYKGKNIEEISKMYSVPITSLESDPYYVSLYITGGGIVSRNPLLFTINKEEYQDGTNGYVFDYFSFDKYPPLPNLDGSFSSYTDVFINAIGSDYTLEKNNTLLFSFLNYFKYYTVNKKFYLDSSSIDQAVSSTTDFELCLLKYCYDAKLGVGIGVIMYNYPEKMAFDMYSFYKKVVNKFSSFPLNDEDLKIASIISESKEPNPILYSTNKVLNDSFKQFLTQYPESQQSFFASEFRKQLEKGLSKYYELIPEVLNVMKRYTLSYQKANTLMSYIVQYLPSTLLLTYNSDWLIESLETSKKWIEDIYLMFNDEKVEMYNHLSANINLVSYPSTRKFSVSPQLIKLGNKMYQFLDLLDLLNNEFKGCFDELEKFKSEDLF